MELRLNRWCRHPPAPARSACPSPAGALGTRHPQRGPKTNGGASTWPGRWGHDRFAMVQAPHIGNKPTKNGGFWQVCKKKLLIEGTCLCRFKDWQFLKSGLRGQQTMGLFHQQYLYVCSTMFGFFGWYLTQKRHQSSLAAGHAGRVYRNATHQRSSYRVKQLVTCNCPSTSM